MKPIACLVGSFPTLTETFIVGEIVELRRRGIPIVVYALGRSRESILQPEALTLADEVRFAAPLWAPRLLVANARWVVRRPGRYARALGLLVGRTWRIPVHLLKTLYLFPKAVELGEHMRQQGIAHVHAHWATYPTTAALIVSEVTGLPYSFTAHAGDVTLFRTLLSEKVRRSQFVVTCTDDLRTDISRLLPLPVRGKVHLNYHGVALERFALQERDGERTPPSWPAARSTSARASPTWSRRAGSSGIADTPFGASSWEMARSALGWPLRSRRRAWAIASHWRAPLRTPRWFGITETATCSCCPASNAPSS